jgi:hypothetical protein
MNNRCCLTAVPPLKAISLTKLAGPTEDDKTEPVAAVVAETNAGPKTSERRRRKSGTEYRTYLG